MNEYQKELKRKNIEKFIKENGYAPNSRQILEMRDESEKTYNNIEKYGFSGFDLNKYEFLKSVSADLENSNRESMYRDLKVSRKRIYALADSMEDDFMFLNKNISRMSAFLDKMESRLNRLILLNSKADLFLYGIEETLDTLQYVDLDKTTAHVERGYATLSKESIKVIGPEEYSIKSYVDSDKTILGNVEFSNPNSLKSKDGIYYKQIVEGREVDQLVKMTLLIQFKKETYVGEVKITGDSIESNSKQYYNVSYSFAEESFTNIKPRNKRFSSGENYTSIGKKVKSIKIEFFKNKADSIDRLNKRYLFAFALDSIELTSNRYKKNSESILYAGPYEILNEDGRPINFSMATIASNTCCITPEKTSISFFLSKDEKNWYGVDYKPGEQSSLIKFGLLYDDSMLEAITEDVGLKNFIYRDDLTEDSLEECIFNFRIKKAESEKINFKNVRIERNLYQDKTIYEAKGGWFYDEKKSNYRCDFYVDSIEGVNIDFGPNSCKIDGREVTGVIRLDEGYHSFETSKSNWKEVDLSLNEAKQIEEQDELYPYNHKLLIEGYPYSKSFKGDKVYLGVGRSFGCLMRYVPREIFYMSSNNNNLNIFTVEEIDGFCYVKARILNNDNSWEREKNNVIIQSQQSDSNLLYVKAIIKSNNEGISPHINSYSIRVV